MLRWNHPELGRIAPSVFIPIAEATGLIVPIGTWILTCAPEATRWSSDIKVAVNLSPVQFRRGREIVDIVMNALAETGLAASRLDLEITETVLIDDSATTLTILEELRSKDVGVSLDDFGTGFASLAYLNDFPFSKIKIDRKFSQNIDQSPRTTAIIKGIAQTTRDLRIELVAEGVETEVQLERMRNFGINAIQGYLSSRRCLAAQLRRVISEPPFSGLSASPTRSRDAGEGRPAKNRVLSSTGRRSRKRSGTTHRQTTSRPAAVREPRETDIAAHADRSVRGQHPVQHRHAHELRQPNLLEIHGIRQVIA